MTIFPIYIKENSVSATSTPSITEISITSSSSTASVDIVPASSFGTFNSSTSGSEVAFGVTTNNLTGYILTIEGNDTEGKLTNDNTGDVLTSITDTANEATFINGDSTIYTNKWGVKPSKLNSLANIDYLPAPTTTNTITMDTTSTANPTTVNNYTIGLGARVDYEKPSGTYTNTFIIKTVGRPVLYQINYLDNSPDSATVESTLPSPDAGADPVSQINLTTATPTRSTYTFNKWCDGTVTHSTSGSTCSGTQYASGQEYTLANPSATTQTEVNLYAMWNPVTFAEAYAAAGKSKVTYSGTQYYTMQDMSTAICASVTNDQTATLLDNRLARYNDSSTKHYYTIAKINGGCWMTQNLTYGYSTSNVNGYNFTISNANVSNRTVTIYNAVSEGPANSGKCYGTINTSTGVATGNGYNYLCVYYGQNSYSGGYTVWYNYAAATAGTITDLYNSTEASDDICPANWRLANANNLTSIVPSYGSTTYVSAFRPVRGGVIYNGNFQYTDLYGMWWINRPMNNMARYHIAYYIENGLSPSASAGQRSAEFYVRCIAK